MNKWWKNGDNLHSLINWLLDREIEYLTPRDAAQYVIDFFEKPWKWNNKWDEFNKETLDVS